MKKKLFYVVEKELQDVDGIEETTGGKTINVYSVVNDGIEKQFDIECSNEENSKEMIYDYLLDNDSSENPEDEFELIQL